MSRLIIGLQGGLGNQLFQYAAGRSIAEELGVHLVLDPFSGFQQDPYGRRFELAEFAINAELLGPEEARRAWERHRLQRNLWWRVEHAGFLLRRTYYNRWLLCLATRLLHICGEVYLSGYFQSYMYFADLADALRRELRLNRPLARERQAMARLFEDSRTAAVHVRSAHGRGTDGTVISREWQRNALPEAYYRRALAELEERGAGRRLVVFADEGGRGPMRIWEGREVLMVPGSANRAADDLVLMSLARHKIIANSTYSWWAAWLGNCPAGSTLAPARWFLHRRRQRVRDLLPPEWQVVDW
jgi:hypothetical protein